MSRGELYRDTQNGKLTGVCAGLANYFELEVWVVRILVISAFLLGGNLLVILAYVALTLMLEKQPRDYDDVIQNKQAHKLKSRPWQQGQQASKVLHTVDQELQQLELKVRRAEAYVTSEAYQVNRQFRNL
jgi:phage shock protein C